MNDVPSITAADRSADLPECPFCLEKIFPFGQPQFEGMRVVIAEPCRHKFHLDCIKNWTKDQLKCPFERSVIERFIEEKVPEETRILPKYWQKQMVNAAKEGNIPIIRALLNRGANPDADQNAGNTPLAWAVKNKHLDAALLLADREESDPIGLTKLGDLLYQGSDDFPANLQKAEHWYLKAARLGSVGAMANLGDLYMHGGTDFPANLHKAEDWLLNAAKLGNVDAMNNLGYLYHHGGKNFPAKPDKAETWYRKAIAGGHEKAKDNLAELMATRLPPDWQLQMVNAAKNGNIETIRHLLNRGANAGAGQTEENTPLAWAAKNKHLNAALLLADREEADPIGLTKLGNLLYQGSDHFPANLHKAEYWYLKAARLGNVVAMAILGYLYMHGGKDFPANPHKAEDWSHQAARLGNVDAMNNLGCLYHHGGKNFPANPDKAETWYRKAIAQGHVKAKCNLTDLMATRLPPNWQLKMVNAAKNGDIETIRQLLNRGAKLDAGQTAGNTPLAWAAKNKHLNAALLLAEREEADLSGLTKLGNLLYQGSDDFPANLPSAKYWYLKAARLGNVVAMASLGYLYMHGGKDFPANPYEAEHWSYKAATLGNADAMNNLGYLYHHGGKNFPANPDKAKTWYRKAIARGHIKAKGNLTDLMATTPDVQRGKERRYRDHQAAAQPRC